LPSRAAPPEASERDHSFFIPTQPKKSSSGLHLRGLLHSTYNNSLIVHHSWGLLFVDRIKKAKKGGKQQPRDGQLHVYYFQLLAHRKIVGRPRKIFSETPLWRTDLLLGLDQSSAASQICA